MRVTLVTSALLLRETPLQSIIAYVLCWYLYSSAPAPVHGPRQYFYSTTFVPLFSAQWPTLIDAISVNFETRGFMSSGMAWTAAWWAYKESITWCGDHWYKRTSTESQPTTATSISSLSLLRPHVFGTCDDIGDKIWSKTWMTSVTVFPVVGVVKLSSVTGASRALTGSPWNLVWHISRGPLPRAGFNASRPSGANGPSIIAWWCS